MPDTESRLHITILSLVQTRKKPSRLASVSISLSPFSAGQHPPTAAAAAADGPEPAGDSGSASELPPLSVAGPSVGRLSGGGAG